MPAMSASDYGAQKNGALASLPLLTATGTSATAPIAAKAPSVALNTIHLTPARVRQPGERLSQERQFVEDRGEILAGLVRLPEGQAFGDLRRAKGSARMSLAMGYQPHGRGG